MSYVCQFVDQVTNTCTQWVEQVTLLEQLAITKQQMAMLGTPIIGIYGVIIAFALFNNFAKRA
ncbi:hypothetical protein [Acinetobacter bereziniae]|uniref:hypothetical protein n=1 Tax=Acinetobacter bereziniae TaxID=106648 RepID=UPI001250B9EE|nr:hypothetical protein [Acinetobacter bereziniae]